MKLIYHCGSSCRCRWLNVGFGLMKFGFGCWNLRFIRRAEMRRLGFK